MDRKKVTETIFQYPESYLQTQKKTLDERINNVQLTDEEHKQIVVDTNKDNVKKVGKELVKTLISPLSIAVETLDWNKNVDNDLREAKKALLLTNYIDKVDSQEKAIDDLIAAMGNLYGNTLVNKIFQMLDNYPPDGDLMENLVSALKKICESKNFEELFQDHKFYLMTIEKLSPQSITLLADYKNWPRFSFQFTGISIGNEISDQYQKPFIEAYFKGKGITDHVTRQRGIYIIEELRQSGFIKCIAINQREYELKLTELGKELYSYLL